MKALITGGAGFIGSHLAEALCNRGAAVTVLDNLSTGKRANLDWRKAHDDLRLVEGDITDTKLARELVAGCDWVFHEAAVASVPQSVEQPLETNRTNLDGTLELLIAARDAKVRRFVFASSSAIYGDSEELIKREGHAVNPLSPYGLQKYAGEAYGRMFYQLYGFEVVSLRYFNVFGPRQSFNSPYSGVIAKFCTTMLSGKRPTIFGDGLQSRDFVYVDNVVHANLLAAEGESERVAGRVFNVAGGESISLLQLAAELNRILGSDLPPNFELARAGDVRTSQADITALRSQTGYTVKVPWQEGLKRTMDFYRDQPG